MVPNIVNITSNGKEITDLYSFMYLKHREIYIFSEINDSVAKEVIAQMEYLDRNGDGDISVFIKSNGGSVDAGLAIIDCMRRLKCDVVTICTGLCASMGAVIFTCGTKGKRFITPLSECMIHQPLGGIQGQAADIEIASMHIHKVKKKIYWILSECTGKSVDQIASDCERDNYMDASEAIEYGLADLYFGECKEGLLYD